MKLEAPMKISSGVRNITQVPSGVRKITIFFGRVLGGRLARGKSRKNHKCRNTTKYLVVVWREIHLGLVIFRPSVGKFEKVQRQRSARRDKSSGPLPFLFDVLYFCIFKIHFPSQIQLCVCLQDFARIWPDSGQTPWGMVWRSWFLLRFRAYLVESGLRSLLRISTTSFISKLFRLYFSSRFLVEVRS